MDFIILKASDDYWYTFRYFDCLENIFVLMAQCKSAVQIKENHLYKKDVKKIMNIFDGKMNEKDAKRYSECWYKIIICDDYIE